MTTQPTPASDYLVPIHDVLRSGVTESRLFDAASNGQIELLFEVHASAAVMLLPSRTGINSPFGVPHPMRTPTHLVLATWLCKRFKDKSSLRVREASRGYMKGSGTILLRCLDASGADDDESMPVRVDGVETKPIEGERYARWASWGFHVNGIPQDHPVNKDDLFVQASELDRWTGRGKREKASPHYFPTEVITREDGNTEFISEQLMRMCEAADKFWGNEGVVPGERNTYPSQEFVAEWFTKQCGFETGRAQVAASLIVPDWAETRGRRSK